MADPSPGLPDKQLYPSVSAVYGNTEVSPYLKQELDADLHVIFR